MLACAHSPYPNHGTHRIGHRSPRSRTNKMRVDRSFSFAAWIGNPTHRDRWPSALADRAKWHVACRPATRPVRNFSGWSTSAGLDTMRSMRTGARPRVRLALLASFLATTLMTACASQAAAPPGVVAPPNLAPRVQVDPWPAAPAPSAEPESTIHEPEPVEPAMLASLSVPNYCFCLAPRSQAQVKLKVGVTNTSDQAISIRADRFRLAVTHPFASDWSAKDPVAGLSTRDGVTLVPPNSDGASEEFDGGWTFATHWTAEDLAPGSTYLDPAVRQGDLVFYVPLGANQSISMSGLVLVDAVGEPIGYLPFSSFGADTDPNGF